MSPIPSYYHLCQNTIMASEYISLPEVLIGI